MELFKCVECGHLFERGEEKKWIEPHGEAFSGCPLCEGNYEEAEQCVVCKSYEDVENEKKICKCCHEQLKKELKDFFGKYNNEVKEILFDLLEEI